MGKKIPGYSHLLLREEKGRIEKVGESKLEIVGRRDE